MGFVGDYWGERDVSLWNARRMAVFVKIASSVKFVGDLI